MNKKLVLALLMATMLAGGAFTVDFSMSVGGGGTFSANFLNYAWTSDGQSYVNNNLGGKKDLRDQNFIGGGFFAYFDATYVMASMGFNFYGITPANADRRKAQENAKETETLSTFDISAFGKFPFSVGSLTLFPLLGIDFKIAIGYDEDHNGTRWSMTNSYVGEYYSSTWFKFGFGADIPLGAKLYLRPMFLYGIAALPKAYQNAMDKENSGNISSRRVDLILHGLDINIAVGYKFF